VKEKSITVVSLGCAKNAVDLQVILSRYLKSGYKLSTNPESADVIVVNTCSFLASARQEAESEILRALELKKAGLVKKVCITGCYPQRYPERKDCFPGVDEWIGVPQTWEESKIPALRLTGPAFAYLKIAEGCSHKCSYCAIPLIRGKYRSRPLKCIMKEARALIATGCKELNIVAQDPMLWTEGKKTIVDLLKRLDTIEGDFWIRVLYSYPAEITEDFIEWMNTSKHAVKYLDVPLQHTVREVLVKMNRAHAVESSINAAFALREKIPGLTLRTTIMTGFPGETQRRFEMMMEDLRKMQFDHLGAFAYSPEEGTAGFQMKNRPSFAQSQRRLELLMKQQSKIWGKKASSMIGKTYKALVVAPGVARLESQAPDVDGVVYINSDEVATFVNIRLIKRKGFDFIGEMA
jgi:ribosomal protein S12 methylthiotransferase